MIDLNQTIYISRIIAFYRKNVLQPHEEKMLEIQDVAVNASKAQAMCLLYIASSWTQLNPNPSRFLGLSLVDDVMPKPSGNHMKSQSADLFCFE